MIVGDLENTGMESGTGFKHLTEQSNPPVDINTKLPFMVQ